MAGLQGRLHPRAGDFTLKLPAQAATAGHRALFEAAQAALPRTVADAKASADVQPQALLLKALPGCRPHGRARTSHSSPRPPA